MKTIRSFLLILASATMLTSMTSRPGMQEEPEFSQEEPGFYESAFLGAKAVCASYVGGSIGEIGASYISSTETA